MSGRKSSLALAISTLALTGCAGTLSIPFEAEHLSHVTQHFDGGQRCDGKMCGSDGLLTGLRFRAEHVEVELLDGYSLEQFDSRHEYFSARISTEIPIARFP